MSALRLRQLVFACETIASASNLRRLLDLGEPFADPGVAEFGLENAVFPIGDQFLEIVAPLPGKSADETAAGRFLKRSGAGGYMAIFQTDDLGAARTRLDDLGIRRVWNADLEVISASHLHPADVGAAIVSIDEPRPASSWLWGGPGWEGRSKPGRLTGAALTAPVPSDLAQRWAAALGCERETGSVVLEGGRLTFELGETERLIGFGLAVEDVAAVLARAAELDLPVAGQQVAFEGVKLALSKS